MQISEMQIAGAGAGKTYTLAELISKKEIQEGKNVYAITFTNFAKKNIEEKVIRHRGSIPDNIKISTIHTFLLNEIIFPYSKFILKKNFKKASSVQLPKDIRIKNSEMARLEDQQIIHNEKVFNIAKQIIVGTKNQSNKEKSKRDIVFKHFISSIDSIFIDEAQDLNQDVIEIIKVLSSQIYIYMVGDPKQAIKYPKVLLGFVEEIQNGQIDKFILLPNKNQTRRLPQEIVNITNLYCPEEQKQTSISEIKGKISYIYVNGEKFKQVINEIKNKNGLIYTRKKDDIFDTQKEESFLGEYLKRFFIEACPKEDDKDAFLYEKEQELKKVITNGNNIKYNFLNKYNVSLPKKEFATLLNKINETGYLVNSIDKVKGLENENCMFILNDSMMDYFLKNKITANKELNYLYVALTRTKRNLILAVNTIKEYKNLDSKLEGLGICKMS